MPTVNLNNSIPTQDVLSEDTMRDMFSPALPRHNHWLVRYDAASPTQKKEMVLQQRYDTALSMARQIAYNDDGWELGMRNDDISGLTSIIQRGLTMIDPDIDLIESDAYPLASGRIVPIQTKIDPAAEYYEYHQVKTVGKLMRGSPSTTMIQDHEAQANAFRFKIQQYWGGYVLRRNELMAIARAGANTEFKIDLAALKREALDNSVMETEHELILAGDSMVGMPGYVNHPQALVIKSSFAIDDDTDPEDIIDLFSQAEEAVRLIARNRTGMIQPDYMNLPPSIARILNRRLYSQNNLAASALVTNSKTIMEHWMGVAKWITGAEELHELEADALAERGLPRAKRIVFFRRGVVGSRSGSRYACSFLRTQPFMMLTPKPMIGWGDMAFAGLMRVAGTVLTRPESLVILEFPVE